MEENSVFEIVELLMTTFVNNSSPEGHFINLKHSYILHYLKLIFAGKFKMHNTLSLRVHYCDNPAVLLG